MKRIHDKLCCLINEVNAIRRNPDFLRKGLKAATPLVPADIYYKFLLASVGIRKGIVIAGGVIKKTKMSLHHPKMAFGGSGERIKLH